jgi:hypothetical protein
MHTQPTSKIASGMLYALAAGKPDANGRGDFYPLFTREGNPSKLLVMLQGGGACWQDFYLCNVLAEDQEAPATPVGIWDFDSPDNPFADYSIVYVPYCDGSVVSGDNDMIDGNFPFGPIRRHRSLRNMTAALDGSLPCFRFIVDRHCRGPTSATVARGEARKLPLK